MTASITKQYQLRTGSGGFTATTANLTDVYLLEISEQTDQATVLELWVAGSGNAIPKTTLRQLGSNYVICDKVTASLHGTQRYWWDVQVTWKELDNQDSEPSQRTQPTPNNNSIDPFDWLPNVSRRNVQIFVDAKEAYYRGGYVGSNDYFETFTLRDPMEKAPLLNSAIQGFDPEPQEKRFLSLWSFRWLRPTFDESLISFEGYCNELAFAWEHRGININWAAKTARIEAVELSEVRWGNQDLWQIAMDVLHDERTHTIRIRDEGTAARAWRYDPDGKGGTISDFPEDGAPAYRQLLDDDGRMIQMPVLLDGSGQPLEQGEDPIFGEWDDFEVTPFGDLPLISELEAA